MAFERQAVWELAWQRTQLDQVYFMHPGGTPLPVDSE
jgi:hypothetical protein